MTWIITKIQWVLLRPMCCLSTELCKSCRRTLYCIYASRPIWWL